ncbi:MAG TPA: response regulator [Candidatus Dormibacteraeota bacterium]|nr:response regulator [Candidatus Dormibacteraeota bacterium]
MTPTRKRILIADCNEDVLIILEKLLEDAGFDTTTAWTAEEALKLADSHVFDLVIVNQYLPDADCEDVLTALQKRGRPIPCIVMQPSAPEFVDFARFEALGAKDIVCKHCFLQIVEIVRECLLCDRKQFPAA